MTTRSTPTTPRSSTPEKIFIFSRSAHERPGHTNHATHAKGETATRRGGLWSGCGGGGLAVLLLFVPVLLLTASLELAISLSLERSASRELALPQSLDTAGVGGGRHV